MDENKLWPLLGLGLLALPFCYRQRPRLAASDLYCLVGFVCFIVVFTGHHNLIPRYFLAVMPFGLVALLMPVQNICTSLPRKVGLIVYLLLGAWSLGDPTSRPSGFFSYRSGLQDGLERSKIVEQHQAVMAATKGVLKDGDEVLTSWPFLEMLRSPHIGYGTVAQWRLVSDKRRVVAPQVILWTNYPEQIPFHGVKEIIARGNYRVQDFSYGYHRVLLYVREY